MRQFWRFEDSLNRLEAFITGARDLGSTFADANTGNPDDIIREYEYRFFLKAYRLLRRYHGMCAVGDIGGFDRAKISKDSGEVELMRITDYDGQREGET